MVPQADPLQPAPETDQVTAVFVVPDTEAVNCCVEPTAVEVLAGVTATETGGLAPVPDRATDRLGVTVELLLMARLPVAAVAVVGLKLTVNVRVWPEFKVAGKEAGARENPLPVMLAELTTTAVLPITDRVIVLVDVVPSVTVPNTRLEGFTESAEAGATT